MCLCVDVPDFRTRINWQSFHCIDDEMVTTTREVISVVKSLRHVGGIKGKNPLVKLICLFNSNTPFCKAKYFDLTAVFVSQFIRHHGIFYLCQALEVNTNDQFVEHALS